MEKFEHRRAEIFRRSAQRISRRKRAGKWAAVCAVPLVLCAALLALPRSDKPLGEESYDTVTGLSQNAPWVTVYRGSDQYVFTDAQAADIVTAIERLLETPNEIRNQVPTEGTIADFVQEATVGTDLEQSFLGRADNTLTIVIDDEIRRSFTLTEDRLIDQNTKKSWLLPPVELAALMELLEIE